MADALYPITVPKWGIEMQEGTITGWQVAVGATVEKGEELIDIETDKIVNTMEAPVAGVVCRQLVDEGETLKVGELLGVIKTAEASDDDIDAFVAAFKPADASFGIDDDVAEETPEAPGLAAEPEAISGEVRVSPVARRLAKKLGVDLSQVTGSGRNGRISKEDVERAAAATEPAQIAATPLTSRRQAIARRLTAAKQDIPHYYVSRTLDMGAALERKTATVGINAIIIDAVATSLAGHPVLNSHLTDDGLVSRGSVDINMAVDTSEGLVAPLLRDVQSMDLEVLTRTSRELAERARNNALSRDDLEAGGFTVSNLGGLGVDAFTAIVNPPQTGILAIGRVREIPVVVDGTLATRPEMAVTLSADHRVVDGADAARFLASLADALGSS